jgi:hypothetical protein
MGSIACLEHRYGVRRLLLARAAIIDGQARRASAFSCR